MADVIQELLDQLDALPREVHVKVKSDADAQQALAIERGRQIIEAIKQFEIANGTSWRS